MRRDDSLSELSPIPLGSVPSLFSCLNQYCYVASLQHDTLIGV